MNSPDDSADVRQPAVDDVPAGVEALPALPVRVWWVIASPIRLFQALRAEPRAWLAILLGGLLGGIGTVAVPLEVMQDFMRNQALAAGGEMPEQVLAFGRWLQLAQAVGILVIWPIITVLQAGLFSAVFLFVFGYEGRFKQYFAVTAHAMLFGAVAGLFLLPIRIATGDLQFSPSLEGFAWFLDEGLIYRWLSFMDVLALWSTALIGIGAGVMDGKGREMAGAAIAVGTLSLVFLLVASFTG